MEKPAKPLEALRSAFYETQATLNGLENVVDWLSDFTKWNAGLAMRDDVPDDFILQAISPDAEEIIDLGPIKDELRIEVAQHAIAAGLAFDDIDLRTAKMHPEDRINLVRRLRSLGAYANDLADQLTHAGAADQPPSIRRERAAE